MGKLQLVCCFGAWTCKVGAKEILQSWWLWLNFTSNNTFCFTCKLHYRRMWFISHKRPWHVCEINFVISTITMYNLWCLLWHKLYQNCNFTLSYGTFHKVSTQIFFMFYISPKIGFVEFLSLCFQPIDLKFHFSKESKNFGTHQDQYSKLSVSHNGLYTMVYIRSVEKPDNHSGMQLVLMTLKVLFKANNYTTLGMTNKMLLFLCRISHKKLIITCGMMLSKEREWQLRNTPKNQINVWGFIFSLYFRKMNNLN